MDNKKDLITEKDIADLFTPQQKKESVFSPKRIFKEILLMGTIFIVSFVLVNWPAVSQYMRYWWHIDFRNQSSLTSSTPTPTPSTYPMDETRLIINRIGVDAPIIWDISYAQINPQLENGVVHYAGTAHPGEIGNTFIIGHSSDYVWKNGQYKQIFALLDKLVPGDKISIIYKGKAYDYEVTNSIVVKPTATEVLNPTAEPTLSLMTCYPVGTTRSRLVVQAKLITPLEGERQKSIPNIYPLPKIR